MAAPAFLAPLIGGVLKALVVRLIAATGMTIITFAGYNALLNEFKQRVYDSVYKMPEDILNLLLIAGFGEGLGYLFGAFAFWVSFKAVGKLAFLPGAILK